MNHNYVNAINFAVANLPKEKILFYDDIFGIHSHANPVFNRYLRDAILNKSEQRIKMVGSKCNDGFIII